MPGNKNSGRKKKIPSSPDDDHVPPPSKQPRGRPRKPQLKQKTDEG